MIADEVEYLTLAQREALVLPRIQGAVKQSIHDSNVALSRATDNEWKKMNEEVLDLNFATLLANDFVAPPVEALRSLIFDNDNASHSVLKFLAAGREIRLEDWYRETVDFDYVEFCKDLMLARLATGLVFWYYVHRKEDNLLIPTVPDPGSYEIWVRWDRKRPGKKQYRLRLKDGVAGNLPVETVCFGGFGHDPLLGVKLPESLRLSVEEKDSLGPHNMAPVRRVLLEMERRYHMDIGDSEISRKIHNPTIVTEQQPGQDELIRAEANRLAMAEAETGSTQAPMNRILRTVRAGFGVSALIGNMQRALVRLTVRNANLVSKQDELYQRAMNSGLALEEGGTKVTQAAIAPGMRKADILMLKHRPDYEKVRKMMFEFVVLQFGLPRSVFTEGGRSVRTAEMAQAKLMRATANEWAFSLGTLLTMAHRYVNAAYDEQYIKHLVRRQHRLMGVINNVPRVDKPTEPPAKRTRSDYVVDDKEAMDEDEGNDNRTWEELSANIVIRLSAYRDVTTAEAYALEDRGYASKQEVSDIVRRNAGLLPRNEMLAREKAMEEEIEELRAREALGLPPVVSEAPEKPEDDGAGLGSPPPEPNVTERAQRGLDPGQG